MPLLNRILGLLPSYFTSVPLEDFITEAFVGILEEASLVNTFCHDFLNLEEDEYELYSQKQYTSLEGKIAKIDMVVRGRNMLCFIENKVESKEGYEQLEKYRKILDEQSVYGYKTKLCYCTKHLDEKAESFGNDFFQYRWRDVANWLTTYKEQAIVNDFLHLLNENNMGSNSDLTLEDLYFMTQAPNLLQKLNTYLEAFKEEFQKKIDSVPSKESDVAKYIRERNQFISFKQNILETGYTEIGFGIDFNAQPKISLWLWVNRNHVRKGEIGAKAKEIDLPSEGYRDDIISFSTPLMPLISEGKSFREIVAEFSKLLDYFIQYVQHTSDWDWKLDRISK
jgi:hypothetical protein